MLPLSKDTRLAARICRLFNVAVRTLSTTKEGIQYDFSSVDVSKHTIKLSDKQKKWRRKDLDGKSLIASTLSEMETDVSFQETLQKVKEVGKKKMTLEEKKIRRRCLDDLGVVGFREFLDANTTHRNIDKRGATDVFQLNIGLYCNQACNHCHVESSPKRKEQMTIETADKCLEILRHSPTVTTLDITGGAPELNQAFRHIVTKARKTRPDLDIIDRCNLTVVHEPGQEDLIDFLVANRVHIIASLPCYSSKNVNTQRGSGVFDRSISALLALNEKGYGQPNSGLVLDLVYNPLGAFLPPPQEALEEQYKAELSENFGIVFNQLFTMTNMPVKRFADFLHRRKELGGYMDLLVKNFNSETVGTLMCKNTVSVNYDGALFDCDFNQQLGLSIGGSADDDNSVWNTNSKTVFDISCLDDLSKEEINFDNHCYGCTAGMGSS